MGLNREALRKMEQEILDSRRGAPCATNLVEVMALIEAAFAEPEEEELKSGDPVTIEGIKIPDCVATLMDIEEVVGRVRIRIRENSGAYCCYLEVRRDLVKKVPR